MYHLNLHVHVRDNEIISIKSVLSSHMLKMECCPLLFNDVEKVLYVADFLRLFPSWPVCSVGIFL